MTYNEVQLKTCPFCGSANIKTINSKKTNTIYFYCNNCQAMVSFGPGMSAKQCAENWNRRTYVKGSQSHRI